MAKQQNDGRNEELDALLQVEGVDTASITEQINKAKGITTPAPTIPPVVNTPPPVIPAGSTPPPVTPQKEVPDPEAIKAAMLNEMFGEQFKTVEDVKKANISGSLQELETLRQRTQELETQLAKKPKHSFASDDIAKFNEFARETGIKDAGIFNKINGTDLANMSDMDALVMQHIIENPSLAGKEPQVRRYFETKYNVDKTKVEAGDLSEEDYEVNLIGVTSDGARAKTKLNELKGKIKMPETPADEPATTKWTPEIEATQKKAWSMVNEKMGETFSTLPITPKGWKEPIVNFVLPEEAKKSVLKNALDYVVSNQMEVNEANVRSVANSMYSDILFDNREEIWHTIAERVRSMSEQEFLKAYHNPAPKNNDTPPPSGEKPSIEVEREKAYLLETK